MADRFQNIFRFKLKQDTWVVGIGNLRTELLILKVLICVHLKTRALTFWPGHSADFSVVLSTFCGLENRKWP